MDIQKRETLPLTYQPIFDTTTGHKREVQSYQKISEALSLNADEIIFLSDVQQELDAAKKAGMKTTQLVRPRYQAYR